MFDKLKKIEERIMIQTSNAKRHWDKSDKDYSHKASVIGELHTD